MIIYNVVAGILFRQSSVLCGQRMPNDIFFPSRWEFPGGKVEKNESKQTALKREIMEELGCDVKNSYHFMTSKVRYEKFSICMDTYIIDCLTANITLNVHKELRWIPIKDMNDYNWCDADKIVVDRIMSLW